MFGKPNSPSAPTPIENPSKKSTTRSSASSVPSILGRDLVITGDIKTDGDVQIDGRLEGNVHAANLTIGEYGSINGKVTAGTVHVRGKVTGKIDATIVELSETANVQADLIQDQLTIANGAFFDGKCSRKSSTPTPLKQTAASKVSESATTKA